MNQCTKQLSAKIASVFMDELNVFVYICVCVLVCMCMCVCVVCAHRTLMYSPGWRLNWPSFCSWNATVTRAISGFAWTIILEVSEETVCMLVAEVVGEGDLSLSWT